LIYQYGKPFAEKYPIKYTKKYWTVEASQLGVEWIGNRMHRPDIDQVLHGAMNKETGNFYYTKEMRYPKKGGYKAFLDPIVDESCIKYNYSLHSILPSQKKLIFKNSFEVNYDHIVSTIPLPELVNKIKTSIPKNVIDAANRLWATSVDLISVAFNKPDIPKHLWFYIYDEDILASRVYSPSIKSPDNCPTGKSSIQFEIYQSKNNQNETSSSKLKENCLFAIKKMNLATEDDIEFMLHDKIEHGNVTFYSGMESDRDLVLKWLRSLGIHVAGRFGEWEYFWSHQSMESGFKAADQIMSILDNEYLK